MIESNPATDDSTEKTDTTFFDQLTLITSAREALPQHTSLIEDTTSLLQILSRVSPHIATPPEYVQGLDTANRIFTSFKIMTDFHVSLIQALQQEQGNKPDSIDKSGLYNKFVALNYYKQQLLFGGLLDAHFFENIGRLLPNTTIEGVSLNTVQDAQFSELLLGVNDKGLSALIELIPTTENLNLIAAECSSLCLTKSSTAKNINAQIQQGKIVLTRVSDIPAATAERFKIDMGGFLVQIIDGNAIESFGPHSPTTKFNYYFDSGAGIFKLLTSRINPQSAYGPNLSTEELFERVTKEQDSYFHSIKIIPTTPQEKYIQFVKRMVPVVEGFAKISE
jgi:hypothetical protein